MGIKKINKWEKAIVLLLNFDGWDLQWVGDENTFYDAKGKTSKGLDCVIEMKFRNKYYEDKLIEKEKYDKLMSLPKSIIKIYFVADTKGNFMYWLNKLKMPTPVKKYCPDSTMWTKKRILKEVFLLKENQASRINLNNYQK
mgnify:FL=1|tara:strand:+ start:378 stop:800 length:423 start_codon:yes stop_codon:yes gene_type:complete